MVNVNYKNVVVNLLNQACLEGLIKTNIDLNLIQNVYCQLGPNAKRIVTWFVQYNNCIYEIPKCGSNKKI